MADYFTGTPSLSSYKLPPAYSTPAFAPNESTTFRGDLGGLIYQPEGMLGAPSAPSPTQPGAAPGAAPSWGKQWGDLLAGVGRFAGGIGAGIAAAKGDPMAGQLLSAYFQDKTGDTDESGESSLVKALKALQESGMISPVKMDSFKLDTGDSSKLLT